MKKSHQKKTGSEKYRQLRNKPKMAKKQQEIQLTQSSSMSLPSINVKDTEQQNTNQLTDGEKFLHQLKIEWKKDQLNTESIDKLLGVIHTLKEEKGFDYVKKVMSGIKNMAQKIPVKGVMNIMANKMDLNELLNNFESHEENAELLQTMMNDPKMKKQAMDMMQEVMNDEEQFKKMTELMTKMLQKDK
ncbi:hypothetical protein ACFSTA_01565 [Ornithinibacillus salinisoli]|uniref:DUF1641 domain-containing protein n=1 Tax=Ornithinibacillus salinisoli TaxID=1848459 RepID=A0ABW4VYK0_9BACI